MSEAAIHFKELLTGVFFRTLPNTTQRSRIDATCTQLGSPQGTFNPDVMQIGDLDPKTALPPRGLRIQVACCAA